MKNKNERNISMHMLAKEPREVEKQINQLKSRKLESLAELDPMPVISPEMLYRQVQYLVEEFNWSQRGEIIGT